MFREWYRQRARQIFPERVGFYARRLDLAWKGIRITSARTRYGSCSADNRLSFSFRLVMAPYDVIDYIVVHELAHIKIKNHSKRFWEYIGKVMPDYRQRKEWLAKKGYLLDI
jgi:predicted metal-dependent hydrolase